MSDRRAPSGPQQRLARALRPGDLGGVSANAAPVRKAGPAMQAARPRSGVVIETTLADLPAAAVAGQLYYVTDATC